MTTQEALNLEIGTIESEPALKPSKVKIVNIEIETIEKAKADKAVFEVKHPDRENTIKLSAVSYLDGKQVTTSGTWVLKDNDGKQRKGSALANLLIALGSKTLKEAIGKEISTELDGKYLVFRIY